MRPRPVLGCALGAALLAPLLGATAAPPVPLLAAGTTARASLTSQSRQVSGAGRQTADHQGIGPAGSIYPAASADGRYVAFVSNAPELLPPCPAKDPRYQPSEQVYLRDRKTGRTELVTAMPNGCPHMGGDTLPHYGGQVSVSADGRCVAFISSGAFQTGLPYFGPDQVWVRDRRARRTTLVTVGYDGKPYNNNSYHVVVSADCSTVAYDSSGSNAVRGIRQDYTNWLPDVYVRDLQTGRTETVGPAVRKEGWYKYFASLSANGRYVTFTTGRPNLVPTNGYGVWPLAPRTDFGGPEELYVYDRRTRRTDIVSVSDDDHAGSHEVGYDYGTRTISDDGRWVVFSSMASNLAPGNDFGYADTGAWWDLTPDVYLYDRVKRHVQRISVGPAGIPGNGESAEPVISGDGRWIAYTSKASNLDVDLTPAAYGRAREDALEPTTTGWDVFLYDRLTATTRLVSRSTDGIQGNGASLQPSLNRDGTLLAYVSQATNLVPDDTNAILDVFTYQRSGAG